MVRNKAGVAGASEGERVEEEEAEDHDDASQDAPPQLLIHQRLGPLFPVDEILHRRIQRVQRPHVERRQSGGERKHDDQNEWAGTVRCDGETGDSVDDPEYKVGDGKYPDVDHCPAERWPDHAVSHADNEKEEEGERVTGSIKDRHNYHERLGPDVQSMPILVIWRVR